MDTVDRETRSKIMRSVPQKNTKPEICLRKALHRRGFRYRLHDKKLPGSPDLVFPKYKVVIFVHGCFWHRHNCNATTTPKSNLEFWERKFKANIERDCRNIKWLLVNKWKVIIVWECSIKGSESNVEMVVSKISEFIRNGKNYLEIP